MYCLNCGKQNQGEAKFCFNCGNSLASYSSLTSTSSVSSQTQTTKSGVIYAGFWKRFAAFILDILIIVLLSIPYFLLLIPILIPVVVITGNDQQKIANVTNALTNIGSFFISWLYYALMESSKKQGTFGKMALGIKVVDIEGKQISFWRATSRYFSRIVSAFLFCVGYLMITFTEKKQALHDKIANCLVVNKNVTLLQIAQDGFASRLSNAAIVAVICLALVIPVGGILAAIIIPAYQDYKIRTQNGLQTNNISQSSLPLSKSENKPVPTKQENSSPVKSVELTEQEYHEESQKLFNNNDWVQLEEHCLKWVEKYPNNSNAWNLLGIAYVYNSKFEVAIQSFQKGHEIVPGDKTILENIEKTKLEYENYTFSLQAKKYFDNSEWFALENYSVIWTKKYKDNPIAWNYLGLAYYNNGKYDKSLKAYKKALEFAPGNSVIMENVQAVQYSMQNVNSNNHFNYDKSLNSRTPTKKCIYKSSMTDEEMRACGLNPKTTQSDQHCIKTAQGLKCLSENKPPQESNNISTYPIICPPGRICPPFD